MRYALLITGQPRTMEFCFPSLKQHILDVYHPDVFVVSDEQRERLIELFNPVGIDVRSQEEIDELYKALRMKYVTPDQERVPAKDLSCVWKQYRAAEMRREYENTNGFDYDVVIQTRFDVKLLKVPPITMPKENTFYVPIRGGYWDTPPDEPGIHWHGYSTQLCWMSSKVSDMTIGIYFEGEDNYKIACAVAEWGYIPEHVLKHYCDRNGIQAHFVDIEMMLIRGTSEAPLSFHHHSLSEYPEYL
jgi:hypothetical protein